MKLSPRRHLSNLIVLAISLALALAGVEAVLRWTTAPNAAQVRSLRQAAAEERGVPFDPRDTLAVLEAYRARGERAFPPVKPFDFRKGRSLQVAGQEVFPLSGVANVLTVFHANETGERFVYRSDEYGFHNPPGSHREDEVDIAVIGDSFAQGVAVRSGEGLTEQIRRLGPRTLNLGMGASGPLIELAILREYAQPLRPDVVLWLYYEANDLVDAVNEARHPTLRRILAGDHEPILRELAAPLDAALVRFAEAMIEEHQSRREAAQPAAVLRDRLFALTETRRRLSQLAGWQARKAPEVPDTAGEDGLDLLRQALVQARDWTQGWGGKMVVVYLPEYARFTGRWPIRPASARRTEVLAVFEDAGLPVIDLLPVFRQHDDPRALFPFSLPGHYDAEGCRWAAEAIVAELARQGLLPR